MSSGSVTPMTPIAAHGDTHIEQGSLYTSLRIFAGSANQGLANDIGKSLNVGVETVLAGKGHFADGEVNIRLQRNVRGSDVFIIQPTCRVGDLSVNDTLMEMLLSIHTAKLSSAKRVTAVIPYFGYARQDRKTKARVPISASAVAQLIESQGPARVVTLDLHCQQIQGMFRIPVDNLYAEQIFVDYLLAMRGQKDNMICVSPDAGGVERARRVADQLSTGVVTILKRRLEANKVSSMQIIGDVRGMDCVIVDDIVDTCGTLCKAAEVLKEEGARSVMACVSHGVLSGPALERLNNSCIDQLVVTDSIPQTENQEKCPRLAVVSIAPLLAKAIISIHNERSISTLFKPF